MRELRGPDPGRPSKYFYWDEVPARRLSENLLEREQALDKAKATARTIERRIEKGLRSEIPISLTHYQWDTIAFSVGSNAHALVGWDRRLLTDHTAHLG